MSCRLELWNKNGVPIKEIEWPGEAPPTFSISEPVRLPVTAYGTAVTLGPLRDSFSVRRFMKVGYVFGTRTVLYREYP